jgi:hypothetical protein
VSNIVAAAIHAVHNDALVSAGGEVLLNRLVGTIGISDEDGASSVHKVVELLPQSFVQLRDRARTANEYAGHRFFRV